MYDNDDVLEGRNPNSRIEENLSAGTYTIEATTYGSVASSGAYTLDVRADNLCAQDLGHPDGNVNHPGTLSSECESTQADGSNAVCPFLHVYPGSGHGPED